MQCYVKVVCVYVDVLVKKVYWVGFDVSFEFVICFLLSELLFVVVIDEDLIFFDYVFSCCVVFVLFVNLWVVFKMVVFIWMQQEVFVEVCILFVLGMQLYDCLGIFVGYVDDFCRVFECMVDSYNCFVGFFEICVLVIV